MTGNIVCVNFTLGSQFKNPIINDFCQTVQGAFILKHLAQQKEIDITRMRDKFDRELFINNGIQGNFEPLSFSKSFTETTTEKSKQWNAPKNSETYEKM